jgi:trk system potassium uptake protein
MGFLWPGASMALMGGCRATADRIMIFSLACFLVALQEELTLTSSVTAVASTLNDVGPGLGQVGATESFEIVNPFGWVVLTVCMLLGSLEIFTVLALLSPAFWKR